MGMRDKITVYVIVSVIIIVLLLFLSCVPSGEQAPSQLPINTEIDLPQPRFDSNISLEQALLQRRSVRDYTGEPLTFQEVSQLLWAAQGITDPIGFRTAPSAGGTYPLEIYLVVGDVKDFHAGIYRYQPVGHKLIKILDGDMTMELYTAALEQVWVKEGAINIVITAVYERTTGKYGERGIRYVHMEAGHAAQNVYLQAVALNLGTVSIGAFHDNLVKEILNLDQQEEPLYIMPVGRR